MPIGKRIQKTLLEAGLRSLLGISGSWPIQQIITMGAVNKARITKSGCVKDISEVVEKYYEDNSLKALKDTQMASLYQHRHYRSQIKNLEERIRRGAPASQA